MAEHRPIRRLVGAGGAAALATLLNVSAPVAAAQTYKCIIDGRTVFQQTGCPANAQLDSPKEASAPAAVASGPRGRAASAPAAAMAAASSASSAAAGGASRSGSPAPRGGAASSVRIDIPRK